MEITKSEVEKEPTLLDVNLSDPLIRQLHACLSIIREAESNDPAQWDHVFSVLKEIYNLPPTFKRING